MSFKAWNIARAVFCAFFFPMIIKSSEKKSEFETIRKIVQDYLGGRISKSEFHILLDLNGFDVNKDVIIKDD